MNLESVLTCFYHYEKVRREGKFNMITEASSAAQAAHLDITDYTYVVKHYTQLKEIVEQRYGSVDKFLTGTSETQPLYFYLLLLS